MSELLIEAESLREALSDPDWVVFDVRYSLTDPEAGKQAYLAGHIPGAYFLDQGTQLAGQATGTNGRHPLPDRQQFNSLLQRHGLTTGQNQDQIRQGSKIVVYDQNDGSFAARAWWLLRWQGYQQVRILNGGLQAWQDIGGPLQTVAQQPAAQHEDVPGAASSATMPTIGATDILFHKSSQDRVLLDARTPERYRGQSEPIDPVAGRIDGALNRPVASNVRSDGRFKSAAQLHDEFQSLLGSRQGGQVVHYCGSGISACHNIFAMELAGLGGSVLYPGSWSEWCSDPRRPVARG